VTQARTLATSLTAALFLATLAIAFTPYARAADAGGAAPGNPNCTDIYHCPNFATTGEVSKDNPMPQAGAKQMATPPQPMDSTKKKMDQPQK
jgi:hypothetical protein